MSVLNIYRDDGFVAEQVLMRASVSLGRHPENDIVLDDRTLSRFHARVERRGDRYVVIDLGAQNGVYLNGNRITGESGLAPGDRIGLGRYVAIFDPQGASARQRRDERGSGEIDLDLDLDPDATNVVKEEREEAPPSEDGLEIDVDDILEVAEGTEPLAERGHSVDLLSSSMSAEAGGQFDDSTTAVSAHKRLKAAPEAAPQPTLILLYNNLEVGRYAVDHELVVGRSKKTDIVISLLGLSRRHARIWPDGGRILVDDMGSQNGTWVNNQRIDGPRPLRHGDLLNFYEYGILFVEDPNVQIDLPGVNFSPDADGLESQETGRRPPVDARSSVPSRAPTSRNPVPIADSDLPSQQRSEEPSFDFGNLGDGSYLEDAFSEDDDDLEAGDALANAVGSHLPEGGGGTQLSELDMDIPLEDDSEIDDVLRAELESMSGSPARPSTAVGQSAYDVDKTAYSLVPQLGDADQRGSWPSDDELEEALARRAEKRLMSLEVYLDDSLYTQMPISQPVTRVGTDARCELALPSAAGLAKWQLTVVRFGATCILYKASADARVMIDDVLVDQAVLKDRDVIQLGRIRVVFKCR